MSYAEVLDRASLPDVAVVIPLYNGERWIRETLGAVRSQTHLPSEVVVVDDGSTDGSREIVSTFPGVRLHRNPDKGANAARRFGQDVTSAPLLAFLDQDDAWHPDHLGLLATALVQAPAFPAAVAATVNVASGSPFHFDPPALDVAPVDPWRQSPGCFTPTPSGALIRRQALEAVGGWPVDYVGVADYYTWLRLSGTHPLLLNRCTSVLRRTHPVSHSTRLRTDSVRLYVRNKVEATVSATRLREAACPEDAEAMRRLRELVSGMAVLVSALLDRDAASVAAAATTIERALDGEPDARVRHVFGNALFYLKPHMSGPSRSEAVWSLLLGAWPRHARRTGRYLRRKYGRRAIARRALRHPFSLARWRPLSHAVADALGQRWRAR